MNHADRFRLRRQPCPRNDRLDGSRAQGTSRQFSRQLSKARRPSSRGAKPDVIVALTVEHWANFFLNAMPAFCIGRAEHYDGPVEEWLRIPKARVPGDAKLAAQLIDACLDGGFDPTFSDELLLDHATFLPLHFLNPNMAIPLCR